MYGHVLIVKFLLFEKAQFSTLNATGHTAFDVAQQSIQLVGQQMIGGKSHGVQKKNVQGSVLELI